MSDLYRYYGGNTKLSSFLITYLFNRDFNFIVWLLLSASKSWIGKLAYPIFYYKKKYGIDIHYTTKIGYGLFIGHGGPLIVTVTNVLRNNATYRNLNDCCQWRSSGRCNWQQCIYWSKCLYYIIDHVKIGDNATAVGNYAKIIHYNNAGNSVNKRWLNGKQNNISII